MFSLIPSFLFKYKNIILHLSKILRINNIFTCFKFNFYHQIIDFHPHRRFAHPHLYNLHTHFYTTFSLHKTFHQHLLLDMLLHHHLAIDIIHQFILFLLMYMSNLFSIIDIILKTNPHTIFPISWIISYFGFITSLQLSLPIQFNTTVRS